jgi:ferric-dicitrate binding protein FerR (iron transport regulator)
MEKVEKIVGLINKYREEVLSQDEQGELDTWLAESTENRSLFEELTDKTSLTDKLKSYSAINSEAIWLKTLQQIEPDTKVKPLYPAQRTWWKYPAVAAAVVGISVAGWLYFKPTANQPVAETTVDTKNAIAEIVPGSTKAILKLSDGKEIKLDNVNHQEKIQQGAITILNNNGRLLYNSENAANGQDPIVGSTALYNTVTTPMGGQYQVILPDGSIVWLNAASSLRFPIAFAGGERNVSLTGEAFFQVSPMANKPFKVAIETPEGNEGNVEVLGTQFNIHAYTEDGGVKTTLQEGSVKLTTKTSNQRVLKPSQEATVDKSGKIIGVKKVDMAGNLAWKNGEFNLEQDVKSLMQDIGRWYNVKIEYAGKVPTASLNGQIPRDRPVKEVLDILKKYGIEVQLNEKERKIVVI